MTRETKVGLLVGMGVILLIGIIVSDHLSMSQKPNPVDITDYGPMAQNSLNANGTGLQQLIVSNSSARSVPASASALPTPEQLSQQPAAPLPGPLVSNPVAPAPAPASLIPAPAVEASVPPAAVPTPVGRQVDSVFAMAPAPAPAPAATPEPVSTSSQSGSSLGSVTRELSQVALSRSEAVPARPTAGPQPSVHYVQRGETLYAIANRYYGNGDLWPVIRQANPGAVKSDNSVNLGVRLVIPNKALLPELVKQIPSAASVLTPVASEGSRPASASVPVAASSRTITVQTGDTLTGLAAKHLGSARKWEELLQANKNVLDKPQDLRVGMVLRLPGSAAVTNTAPAAQTQAPAPAQNRTATKVYTVVAGDTLYRIAEKQMGDGNKWNQLFEANRDKLKKPNDLAVGMKLNIPVSR